MNKQKKNKQKVLLTIPWTKSHKTAITKISLKRLSLIVLILLITIPFGLISGILPFAFNTLRCGRLPVESTKFAAAFSYELPGDEGYGINMFSDYNFCTEAEIQSTNGYRRSVLTEAGRKQQEDAWAKHREQRQFSLSRIDYQVYRPAGYEIERQKMSEIKGNIHTFYNIKREGTLSISVRQLKKDDSYNICKSNDQSKRYCKVIGKDSQGREVRREYTNGIHGWKSYYVGINIGDTGIILGADNDQEAIEIFGAMQPYTE